MLLARLVGEKGFVLCVEPAPFNAMMVNAQLGLNAARNCLVVQAAASDRKGTARISFQSNSNVTDSPDGIEVPSVTADELDKEFGPFHVLKIDVEGFEGKVLAGARELLRRKPVILLELHCPSLHVFGTTIEQVLSMLEPGYQGTLVPRKARSLIQPFSASGIPTDDIVNLFLTAP